MEERRSADNLNNDQTGEEQRYHLKRILFLIIITVFGERAVDDKDGQETDEIEKQVKITSTEAPLEWQAECLQCFIGVVAFLNLRFYS